METWGIDVSCDSFKFNFVYISDLLFFVYLLFSFLSLSILDDEGSAPLSTGLNMRSLSSGRNCFFPIGAEVGRKVSEWIIICDHVTQIHCDSFRFLLLNLLVHRHVCVCVCRHWRLKWFSLWNWICCWSAWSCDWETGNDLSVSGL